MSEAPDGPFDAASRQAGAPTSDQHSARHTDRRCDRSAGSAPDSRPERIPHDERGRSIKEWSLETGLYSRDVGTGRLRKLESNDLFIADSVIPPRSRDVDDPSRGEQQPDRGSNPYDNSSTSDGNVAGAAHNGAGGGALKPGGRSRPPT